MKVLVINGPNLNKLNLRDKSVYGNFSLDDVNNLIQNEFKKFQFVFKQCDSEAEIINLIHDAKGLCNGIVFNPGAFSHNSVAIRDAMEISKVPIIEVHLSNLSSRENFRNVMITASKSIGYISGFRENSYIIAVYALTKIVLDKKL
jgi:3-dehydroquinate dehydratase II